MADTIDAGKLLHYLGWLAEESKFNAVVRERDGLDSKVSRECERVANMLIEQIQRGDYDVK